MTPQLAKWFSDEPAIVELKALLSNPVMRRALDIVTRIGLPAQSTTPPEVDLLQWGALTNASREGYFQALANLEALATAPTRGERAPMPQPWEYLVRKEVASEPAPKPAPTRRRKIKAS